MAKIHIAILCGGQSSEHEVSLQSAKNIIQALDPNRYETIVIVITRQGEWIALDSPMTILNNPDMQPLSGIPAGQRVYIQPGQAQPLMVDHPQRHVLPVEVIFPVLHGRCGEDGTIQGLLSLLDIPYVGSDTLGSAVSMDKAVSKNLLENAGLPIAKWRLLDRADLPQLEFHAIVEQLGLPLFVKPANAGSSIGVSKVHSLNELTEALQLAVQYDHKIILESHIAGREIECSVLGNQNPEASLPGEIISHHEFYSYAAKYLDPQGAALSIPADLSPSVIARIQALAKQVFLTLGCQGMARIDFFLTSDDRIVVNEANTLPGFTQISMYPQLWQVSGLEYSDLVDRLVQLAFDRAAQVRTYSDAL